MGHHSDSGSSSHRRCHHLCGRERCCWCGGDFLGPVFVVQVIEMLIVGGFRRLRTVLACVLVATTTTATATAAATARLAAFGFRSALGWGRCSGNGFSGGFDRRKSVFDHFDAWRILGTLGGRGSDSGSSHGGDSRCGRLLVLLLGGAGLTRLLFLALLLALALSLLLALSLRLLLALVLLGLLALLRLTLLLRLTVALGLLLALLALLRLLATLL